MPDPLVQEQPGATIAVDNASFPGVKAFLRRLEVTPSFVSTVVKMIKMVKSDRGPMTLGCFMGGWHGLARA